MSLTINALKSLYIIFYIYIIVLVILTRLISKHNALFTFVCVVGEDVSCVSVKSI